LSLSHICADMGARW